MNMTGPVPGNEGIHVFAEKGVAPVMEPATEPWGQRTCSIADPEGNLIEIGSWNKPYEKKDGGIS